MNVSDLMSLADTHISVGMAAIVLFAVYVTYRTGRRAVKTALLPFKIFAPTYAASAFTVIAGLLGTGYGIGELTAEPFQTAEKPQTAKMQVLTNDQIVAIAGGEKTKNENVKEALAYAAKRDELLVKNQSLADQPQSLPPAAVVVAPEKVERPINHRLGWMSIFGGLGSLIFGAFIGFTKLNGATE